MGQKTAGTCYVKADGAQLAITGGCEAPVSDVKRETIVVGYFKEEDLTPYLKVSAVDTPDLDVQKIVKATDMTITCEFKNGKTYVLSGAYVVGEASSKGDDGTIEFEFNGSKGIWQ